MSEGRHIFSKEEGGLGVRNSRLSRKAQMKLEKMLAKSHLDSVAIGKFMDILKVLIASPAGVFLGGYFLISIFDKLGFWGGKSTDQQKKTYNAILDLTPEPLKSLISLANQIPGGSLLGDLGVTPLPGSPGSPNASSEAEWLKIGLFSICMMQAAGGGQGISTLATAAIAGTK